ncbi:MAG: PP2C family protein-serine/threonine phosphatase [Phycisphaerales bacterium]
MSTRTISVIAADARAREVQRLTSDVLSAWPAFSDAPEVQATTLAEASRDGDRIAGSAVLVLLEDAYDAELMLLVDTLEQRLTPMVVVAPASADRPAPQLGRTVLFAPDNAPAATIAAMLHTLLERQPFIDDLRSEIRLSQRFQGGLREEMSKMHEEMQLAGRVQREFLPHSLPKIDGAEFEVFFRPCGYVSGDIYDVVRLDDRHAGFVLADAVGHGVPAALMTMVLTRALPMIDHFDDGPTLVQPADALRRLNQALIRGQGETSRFATAVYGVIDAHERRVTIAGAGHPPPLRITPRTTREVITEGPLLGVFADATFNQVEFTLDEDEVLVLYSDGFETAFPTPAEKDLDRRVPTSAYIDHFRQIAQDRERSGLPEAVRLLADAIDLQAGSLHQVDDLSALVIAPAPRKGVGVGGADRAAA